MITDIPMDVAGRLERLRALLGDAGCDVLLVSDLANVRYLSGFSGSAGAVVVGPEEAWLVTDGRYRDQAEEELASAAAMLALEIVPAAGQDELLRRLLGGRGRVGLEARAVSWARQRALAGLLAPAELVATNGVVEGLRRVKDDGELSRMAEAALVADRALAAVSSLLATSLTEVELAVALESEMRRLGASGTSFPTIVGSGPNGARPHAQPTERRVQRGDLVVVDFGAVVGGYCSDTTRTLCAGEPSDPSGLAVAEAVAAAQDAGLAAVRAGEPAAAVDAAARKVIADAGWGDQFVHGTGHGIGLEVHEAPGLNASSTATLEAGAVVTVEPGVYLTGRLGVRIEDTVVVTGEGFRPLSRAPKEIVVG
ncbi:MAG: M24 family metallopeptidase [Acidimicrobiales bacterium]